VVELWRGKGLTPWSIGVLEFWINAFACHFLATLAGKRNAKIQERAFSPFSRHFGEKGS
jgi:hypothetical protein